MWRAASAIAACLVFAGAVANGASPPLPPRRPPELRAAPPGPPQPDALAERERAEAAREACLSRLTASGVHYQSVARVEDGACIVVAPIRLEGLATSGNASGPILFPARPLIDCELAQRLADWLRQAASPLLEARFNASLKAVVTGTGYQCRTRNREPDSKLSAHALGLAVDISAFELTDRQRVSVGADGAVEALGVVRRSACGWFTTVLGPGSSDGFHESHLHVDIQPHGSRASYHICE